MAIDSTRCNILLAATTCIYYQLSSFLTVKDHIVPLMIEQSSNRDTRSLMRH